MPTLIYSDILTFRMFDHEKYVNVTDLYIFDGVNQWRISKSKKSFFLDFLFISFLL